MIFTWKHLLGRSWSCFFLLLHDCHLIGHPIITMPTRHSSKYANAFKSKDLGQRLKQLAFFEHKALEDASRANLDSIEHNYSVFVEGAGYAPFPVTFTKVGLYLVQYCHIFGNTTRSIPSLLSNLKRSNRAHGFMWLNEIDKARLDDVIAGLKKYDRSVPARKLPMTHSVLADVQRAAEMSKLAHYQHITMARVAKDALLRGGELVKLRRCDVLWSEDKQRVKLRIVLSKANKVGAPEYVTITDYGSTSGVAFLREYFRLMGFITAGDPSVLPLWPVVTLDGKAFLSTPMSKLKFVALARNLLAKAGYKAKSYSGHSYRSGGATDLWDSHRCRPLTIKLHGRWKSDAYCLYIRDNPDRTADEVAQAMTFFQQASSN